MLYVLLVHAVSTILIKLIWRRQGGFRGGEIRGEGWEGLGEGVNGLFFV
jgi:hypothetical protein